jgi:hypothetical protein
MRMLAIEQFGLQELTTSERIQIQGGEDGNQGDFGSVYYDGNGGWVSWDGGNTVSGYDSNGERIEYPFTW